MQLDNKYELQRKLGSGKFGSIWKGYNLQTKEEVAVKLVNANDKKE